VTDTDVAKSGSPT